MYLFYEYFINILEKNRYAAHCLSIFYIFFMELWKYNIFIEKYKNIHFYVIL